MNVLGMVGAVLVLLGALGAYWAYRRSLSSLETIGEAAAQLPPPLAPKDSVEVRQSAHPDVVELNAIAARLEAGEKLTPAEHARVAQLVRDLEQIEHKQTV